MNRRNFLKNILMGGAMMALAPKAVVEAVAKPLPVLSGVALDGYHGSSVIVPHWFQTKRLTSYCSQAYTDALDEILAKNPEIVGSLMGKFSRETAMRPIP